MPKNTINQKLELELMTHVQEAQDAQTELDNSRSTGVGDAQPPKELDNSREEQLQLWERHRAAFLEWQKNLERAAKLPNVATMTMKVVRRRVEEVPKSVPVPSPEPVAQPELEPEPEPKPEATQVRCQNFLRALRFSCPRIHVIYMELRIS